MKNLPNYTLLILIWIFSSSFISTEPSDGKLKTLYNSLDPTSISEHLAFYELYSHTQEGQKALNDAYSLLSGGEHHVQSFTPLPPSLSMTIHALIALINKQPNDNTIHLNREELDLINKLAERLPNRYLKGHLATSEKQILELPPKEIDLARGLLLSQLGNDLESLDKIKSYEASIDLMALQILTKIKPTDPPKTKIRAINSFIFEEMGFRFPPHSTYAKDIDLYTFLPSVLDSRRGVCLGVSILYLCLAQRLNLDLEIVIPPGHIFVRYHKGNEIINIETTARGICIPDDEYLGVDLRSLPQCNIKETIGMAHFNQASVFWEREEHDKAMIAYEKALPYLPHDKLLQSLMGFTAVLQGDELKGKSLLREVTDFLPDHAVSKETMAEDYIKGYATREGISAFFMRVDETRQSLLLKKEALEASLKTHPKFREGLFSLAGTWLQLHRTAEALDTLERYHAIDPTNATVEYYISALYAERLNYNLAWKHLRIAEKLAAARDHYPDALKEMRQELSMLCPELL